MSFIRSVAAAIWELFVDEGSLAAFILAWCGCAAVILPALGLAPEWQSLALAVGLLLILAENVRRSARGLGRRR